MLINTSSGLKQFIQDLGTPPYVALDTEFLSEKTYYPQLCLVQLGFGEHAAVIDPLSNLDLAPLLQVLSNPKIIKVLHSAEQDLAILWNNFQLSPVPIFDTQIAAMVCGFGDQVAYGQLVRTFTGKDLDKSSQIIDWSRRPLRDRHIEYALADVTNLGPVYEALQAEINTQGRASWVQEEMRELSDPKRWDFDPVDQIRKLKMNHLSPRRLAMLQVLIQWREGRAQSQNLPRGWVLKDLAMRDLVSNPPKTLEDLNRVRSIGGNARGQVGREILECLQTAAKLPPSDLPAPVSTSRSERPSENTIVLLRSLLSHICEKNRVAPKLVASKADLESIALGLPSRVATGWRWDLFGQLAQQLIKGQIALALSEGEIIVVETS